MIIKKANLGDVSEIVKLWLDFMKEHDEVILKNERRLKPFEVKAKDIGKKYEAFVRMRINSKNGIVFLALKDNEIAGYALVFVKDEIPIYRRKKVGYISDLYVKGGFRKQGISTKLKNQAILWLKNNRIDNVALPLYPANKSAHSIYKKWGFFDYKIEMRKKI